MTEFIVANRRQKLQRWWRARYARRNKAARLLTRFCRSKLQFASNKQIRVARIEFQRTKAAINRVADLYRLIKVRKVAASMALNTTQLYEQTQEILRKEEGVRILKAVTAIQRLWRTKREQKFALGRKIAKNYKTEQGLFSRLSKYRGYANDECKLLHSETMFEREQANIEGYWHAQMISYLGQLDGKAQKVEQRILRDYQPGDWTFNSSTREWTSNTGVLKFSLTKDESGTQSVLKDKLTQFYVKSQMPAEHAIRSQLQTF